MLKVLDLFSGIGGFSLGLKWAGGFETVGFCEKDAYCRRVLGLHWPNVPIIEDIADVTTDKLRSLGIGGIDMVTAGFPCQPFSQANTTNRKGSKDERYLWPELIRSIRDIEPRWIVLENVPGLLTINRGREFGIILGDLAQSGFNAEWQVLPAAAFGARHIRERLFVIATPQEMDYPHVFSSGNFSPAKTGYAGWLSPTRARFGRNRSSRAGEPSVARVAYGVSDWLDRRRTLGNAIYPPIAKWLGEGIKAAESSIN